MKINEQWEELKAALIGSSLSFVYQKINMDSEKECPAKNASVQMPAFLRGIVISL